MLGMDMLVKSFGIDPEKIQSEINAAGEFAKQQLVEIREQLNRIEGAQLAIVQNQRMIYQAMVKAGLIEAFEEPKPEVAGELCHEPRVN